MATQGQQSDALPPLAAIPWSRRLANRFWGYDFFVSYHWGSGGAYAVKLAEALRARRFDCFLDRSEFAGGDDWKDQARQALANTQRLIVIGTREALSISDPVRDEVTIFTARSERVIPILFGERVPDDQRQNYPALNLISNRVVEIIEDAENQTRGPSDAVLEQIENAHGILRRRRLRAILVTGVIVVLAAAAVAASVSFLNAEAQRRVAQKALIDSQRELAQSLVERGVRDAESGNRIGLLRLRRAYEIAERSDLDTDIEIPRDAQMSRSARRLLAGWQTPVGLGLLHDETVSRADLSPDGALVRTLTLNIDGEPTGYEFWEAHTGRPLGIRIPVDDENFDLAMSPDWTIAIHWSGSTLRRWDLRTGEMRELKPPPQEAGNRPAPVHSPEGRWGAKRGAGSLEIWDLETGQPVRTLRPGFEDPGALRFSADGGALMAMSDDRRRLALFETETGRSLGAPLELQGAIATVRMSDDGHSAANVLEDGSVVLLDTAAGETRLSMASLEPSASVNFSPDGGTLLVTSGARTWLVDVPEGTVRGELRHEEPVALALFSPDGRILATSGKGRAQGGRPEPQSEVRIVDVQTARQRFRFKRAAEAGAALQFSPDGSLLLALNANGFEVYDARTGHYRGGGRATTQGCDPGSQHYCRQAGFSADGGTVYTLTWKQRVVRLVQIVLPVLVLNHPEQTAEVALSPDATRLLTANRDGSVQMWDVTEKTAIAAPVVVGDRTYEARFSQDGAWAVTEHGFGTFRTWDAATGKPRDFPGEGPESDGELMLGAAGTLMLARDGTGQVFDFESGTFGPRTLPVPDDFGPFAFSGDGRLLATTGYGRDILVRDLITGSAHAPLNPRSGVVEDLQEFETVEVLAFSPDSARLLAATTLGTLRIWDAASGRIELEISEPNGRIDQAIFSPDGEVVAVIHRSTVRLLDVATGAMIEDIAVWHAESLAFSADGRHLFVANPEATFRWRVPELPDQPERIGRWVEIRALAEWGEQSSPTPIGLAEWTQTWRRLDAAGGPFR